MVKALIIVAVIIFAVILIAGAIIANIMVHGKRQTLDEAWEWQQENVRGTDIFNRADFVEYTVKDDYGYLYHVMHLPAKEPSDKYVILAHGYTDTRFGMVKYMPHYYALGFNCVIFDERGHGENEPAPCTYGIREVRGLIAVLKDTKRRYGDDIRIGLHGESLGGATVLTSMKYDEVAADVSFIVDDCGFVEIVPVLKGSMKQMHIPSWLVYPASFMAKLMFGESFTAAYPLKAIEAAKAKIPLLIIHGAEDDFILPEHSKRAKEAAPSYSELHLIQGAGHAASAVVAPDEYGRIIKDFLKAIDFE